MKNKKGNKNSTRELRSPLKPSNILDAPARAPGVYKGTTHGQIELKRLVLRSGRSGLWISRLRRLRQFLAALCAGSDTSKNI